MNYPHALNEWETIKLLQGGQSIARYGDGELKLCRGASAKSQKFEPHLGDRLKEILMSLSNKCLVGIPRLDKMDEINPEKHKFWNNYRDPIYIKMYNPKKKYTSAYITRPDSVPAINTPEYMEAVQKIWTGRHVILINGDNKPFDKHQTILSNAASYEKWQCPSQNTWEFYDKMMWECHTQKNDVLFLLACGATATVLAYDLAHMGYQAIDIGHFGMFYNRFANGIEINAPTIEPFI